LNLPHASLILPDLRVARRAAGHLLVGLDYDGTLTPIVASPDDAHLPSGARRVLTDLAARADTTVAVLSGRALADVRARVGVNGIFYAGNHGLEVEGPGLRLVQSGALTALPALRQAGDTLGRELAGIAGVIVEDKGVSLTVHYRQVARERRAEVRSVAVRTGMGRQGIRVTEGKMVVELRPDLDWHKGSALEFLRASLPGGEAGPAVFVGDDRTDEDAFRALGPGGWGVVVAAETPPATAARAILASPAEVVAFLGELVRDP
jgi:trehalose 6-phosphate phosphatase